MFARYAVAVGLGIGVTATLLFMMQLMVYSGRGALTEGRTFEIDDFVRIEREQTVETRKTRPDKPPEPELPPERPTPATHDSFDGGLAVAVSEPKIAASVAVSKVGFGVSDGEYLPIVKVAPVYPTRALARRLEGYVLVEFTVTPSGSVKDVVVLESTAAMFEQPAIDAAMKFKYKPRVVGGQPIEVRGVLNRIVFVLEV